MAVDLLSNHFISLLISVHAPSILMYLYIYILYVSKYLDCACIHIDAHLHMIQCTLASDGMAGWVVDFHNFHVLLHMCCFLNLNFGIMMYCCKSIEHAYKSPTMTTNVG